MRNILRVIKTTLIGGLFFIAPFVVLIIILEKAFKVVQNLVAPILKKFPGTYIERQGVKEIIVILLILLLCFIVGIFASTGIAKNIVSKIENGLLEKIPGYLFIKKMSESIVGIETKENLPVLLVPGDDGWKIAFQIEKLNDDLLIAFVPDTPNPWSGNIVYMKRENVVLCNISQKRALELIKNFGVGSAAAFKDILPQLTKSEI